MIRALLFVLLLMLLRPAEAEAVVICTPNSSGIAFGNFTGSSSTVIGLITLHCAGSGKADYTLTLSTGISGTYSLRTMKSGANNLAYNLYKEPAFTQIWGDGTGGSTTVTGTIDMKNASIKTEAVTLYARLPSQALLHDGAYSDTIVATLSAENIITTTSFPVTALVQPICTISATNLAFGTYSGEQLNARSQILLTCTSGLAWNVGLNAGNFPGATVTTRRMQGRGNSAMAYSLYRDAARTLNWGDSVGIDTLAGTGTGGRQLIDVYGQVPPSQSVGIGGYQDTIVATVTF